ncbi:MAG: SGNH/GDSL hydrolase family protein [Steroidobacteraceae bacterium]
MKRRFKAIALILIATIALAMAETILRFAYGFGRPLLYASDPVVGYLPKPNQLVHRFGATNRINASSMRADEFAKIKDPNSFRLFFIGDSVTYGTTYVEQNQIFTERIGVALSKRLHRHVEILNASAGGWAPENEYRYLRTRGTYGADAVIFVINTNDLDQMFERLEVSPQFPTKNPLTAVGEVWERYIEPRIYAGIRTTDPGSQVDTDPDIRREQGVLRTLENARALTAAARIPFALIFSPAAYEFEHTPAWQAAVQNLFQWASAQRVELVDMTPVYARYSKKQVYLDDIHLTPFGHELVATEFLAHISKIRASRF